jgi:hypothetical protein
LLFADVDGAVTGVGTTGGTVSAGVMDAPGSLTAAVGVCFFFPYLLAGAFFIEFERAFGGMVVEVRDGCELQ